MENIQELESAFQKAAEEVRKSDNLSTAMMLRCYGLFKQATVGPCNISKPGMFSFTSKHKWEAWNLLGSMTRTEAMSKYIELVGELLSGKKVVNSETEDDDSGSALGVRVSCMAQTDQQLSDEEKTVFDWLKEGNIQRVSSLLNAAPMDQPDENGMLLIHWAADRGDTAMVRLLIESGCDLNAADELGQTPLHYASACGHADVILFLLQMGADSSVRDKEGNLASDLTES